MKNKKLCKYCSKPLVNKEDIKFRIEGVENKYLKFC